MLFSFIDWMQQMDEQEERENPHWKASNGFPLGGRSYWIEDSNGKRYGEAILFYRGDGTIFARVLLAVSLPPSTLEDLLQALYDKFDYFKNLECSVWRVSDLGTFETLQSS